MRETIRNVHLVLLFIRIYQHGLAALSAQWTSGAIKRLIRFDNVIEINRNSLRDYLKRSHLGSKKCPGRYRIIYKPPAGQIIDRCRRLGILLLREELSVEIKYLNNIYFLIY